MAERERKGEIMEERGQCDAIEGDDKQRREKNDKVNIKRGKRKKVGERWAGTKSTGWCH